MKRARMIITLSILMTLACAFSHTSAAFGADKTKIGVATIAPTMGSYPAMVALADYLNKNTNLNLTLSSVGGANAIATSVEKMGQTGMGMGFSLVLPLLYSAYHGVMEYDGNPNKSLRMMFMNFWEYAGIFTVPGKGITDISQAKGKRFPRYTRTRNAQYPPLFWAYGIDYNKDLKLINVPSPGKGAKELGLGRLDLSGGTIAGSKIIRLSEAAGGVIVLPLDPDKFAQAKEKFPMGLAGFESIVLPPGEVPGVSNEKPTPVMDFKLVCFAHKDLPDEAVYTCVRAFLDKPETVKGLHRLFKRYSLDNVAPIIGVPYHEGAIKALKEKGLWTDKHEKEQRKLMQ